MSSEWVWYVEMSGPLIEWRLPVAEHLLFWE
jgi:hypothetical protein